MTAYLTVLPLGLQAYLGPVKTWLNPAATTLGIECCFYLFSPWVLRSSALSLLAAIAGLGIFLAGQLGVFDFNTYTYYTFPGPLIFYMIGHFVYRKSWLKLTCFAVALTVILLAKWQSQFSQEYLVVMAIGLPVFIFLSRFPQNKIDSMLGDASYGCYLGHGLVIYVCGKLFGPIRGHGLKIAAVTVAALAVGYLSYWLVERPTIKFRRRIRGHSVPLNCSS